MNDSPYAWVERFTAAFPADARKPGYHWVNGTLMHIDTCNSIKEFIQREVDRERKLTEIRNKPQEMGTYRPSPSGDYERVAFEPKDGFFDDGQGNVTVWGDGEKLLKASDAWRESAESSIQSPETVRRP